MELARETPRFGYRRLHVLLRRIGEPMSFRHSGHICLGSCKDSSRSRVRKGCENHPASTVANCYSWGSGPYPQLNSQLHLGGEEIYVTVKYRREQASWFHEMLARRSSNTCKQFGKLGEPSLVNLGEHQQATWGLV